MPVRITVWDLSGDNIGLSKNFEVDGNLGGLIESKPSKFEILDIRRSPTGEK
jgi:hypothetical protein